MSAIARFSEASALSPFNFWGPSYEAALGEAYLADGQTEQAMQQFEMVLRESPYRKLLHYEFGKILEQTGDTARAASEYQTFLNSWKDADPDLPVLIAAKNRLAELSSRSS